MKTSRRKIAALLAERSLAASANAAKLSREVAAYLLQTGRTSELSSLLRDVQALRAERGVVEVMAITAHDLSAGARKDIEAYIRQLYPDAKQIIISEVHDEDVIGGVRLELANQQLDLSIRGKLNRFKQLTAIEY
jgi:F0F1-type ATP synthase delta subunit